MSIGIDKREPRSSALAIAGAILVVALMFVWPVPHTVTLRNALLFATIGVFWVLAARGTCRESIKALATPGVIYATLTIWLVFVALFISTETIWSLREIRGEWLKGALALTAGLLVGCASRSTPLLRPNLVVPLLIAPLMLHVLYIDGSTVYAWVRTGTWEQSLVGWIQHPTYANHVSNMVFVLLCAEMLSRGIRNAPTRSMIVLALGIVAILGSSLVEFRRNGFIELGTLFVVLFILFLREKHAFRSRLRAQLYVTVAVVGAVVFLHQGFKQDGRWSSFLETIPVALDTEGNLAWIDMVRYPPPKLPTGEVIDSSSYLRIAWFKEGLKIVAENPLGVGYGRNAFGHVVVAKHGGSAGSSHSGLLDFAIGAGVPGALLWCLFLGSLATIAYRGYRRGPTVASLALLLLVVGYSVRMILDANIRDHILEQFLFVVGILSVLTVTEPRSGAPQTAHG